MITDITIEIIINLNTLTCRFFLTELNAFDSFIINDLYLNKIESYFLIINIEIIFLWFFN